LSQQVFASGKIIRGTAISNQIQGSLNPEWVEMLMGLPVGWTDINGQPSQDKNSFPMSQQEPSLNGNPIKESA
jgi:hypothetical protein